MNNFQEKVNFIWAVADLLRGDYKQSDYGKVILPFTVLRRLDCVLEATKPAVLAELATRQKAGLNPEPFLLRKSKVHFFNTTPLDRRKLVDDPPRAPSSRRHTARRIAAGMCLDRCAASQTFAAARSQRSACARDSRPEA